MATGCPLSHAGGGLDAETSIDRRRLASIKNPALANRSAEEVIAENSTNRDRLRQYLQDLATQKEQEFQVADREAQRCRGALLQQPAPKNKKASQKVSQP